jgi:hypothetical protein
MTCPTYRVPSFSGGDGIPEGAQELVEADLDLDFWACRGAALVAKKRKRMAARTNGGKRRRRKVTG